MLQTIAVPPQDPTLARPTLRPLEDFAGSLATRVYLSLKQAILCLALRPGEIATTLVENAGLDTVMTNSFGFGGTNGSMLLSRLHD